MRQSTSWFTLTLLSGTLLAQNFAYSPSTAATTATGGGNTIPWLYQTFNSQRYMQVHNDFRGKTMLVNELALRRGPETTVQAGSLARAIDCELFVGHGDYATSTLVFATNYKQPPTNVVNRKQVNLPDLTQPQGSPAPFSVLFPFDTMFLYLGNSGDFVWEIALYTSTLPSSTYFTEGLGYDDFATTLNSGTGCLSTGQTNRMLQQIFIRSLPALPQPLLDVTFRIFYGPIGAPATMLIGTTPVNVPIPGLCTNLYVGNILLELTGPTLTANGVFTAGWTQPWNPALVGLSVTVQGAALDTGQPLLAISATQGCTATIVPLPTRGLVRRIYGGLLAASGSTDTSNGTPLPYGLVTRLKY